jgi:hypothetical protein
MPLQATSGAASYDAFGGGAAAVPQYIEDVFSTFVYTGTSAARNIVNGIDLAGKGGLAWIKCRTVAESNSLFTTNLGANKTLLTNETDPQDTVGTDVFQAFNSDGFRVGNHGRTNESPRTYASWTFRKQPKFFDVVTYTGDGTSGRTVAHSLGSVPGCIITKRLDNVSDWRVYHRSLGATKAGFLNADLAPITQSAIWNDTEPTSTVFTLGNAIAVNASGGTYVAYLFAHDAGGFGLTGTDNVISCGSYVGDGTTNGSKKITLGYEPQFLIMKPADSAPSGFNGWNIMDTMRGIVTGGNSPMLRADNSGIEDGTNNLYAVEADGFRHTYSGTAGNDSGITYIYIAIRRGPMKVPTDGTKVFAPVLTASSSETVNTVGFAPDMQLIKQTENAVGTNAVDRLRGVSTRYQFNAGTFLLTSSTAAEASNFSTQYWNNTSFSTPSLTSGTPTVYWTFSRAPSVFDVVCYTGVGFARVDHNLQAVPELILIKSRSASGGWAGVQLLPDASNGWNQLSLQSTSAGVTVASQSGSLSSWMRTNDFAPGFVYRSDGTTPTTSGVTYVAYLFATCPGVSKVGSYTGNGTTQAIACGFTGGARFVLIKRTDSTGDWYVYDTARGMTVLTDPYLRLNSTAAETATLGSVITSTGGFTVNAAILAAINTNAASYIFLAIA